MKKKPAKRIGEKAVAKPRKNHANNFMSYPEQRELWDRAAASENRSFSSWACLALDEAAKRSLARS